MIQDAVRLVVPAFAIVLLALIGFTALTLVARSERDTFAPAMPAIGFVVAVVVLYGLTSVLPVDVGAPVLVGAAALVLAHHAVRARGRLRMARSSWVRAGVGVAIGVLPLTVALQPAFRVDDGSVMHPTGNHDAFWYVSLASWLEDHPGLDEPSFDRSPAASRDVPSDFPARSAVDEGFRLGESLVHAAVADVTGRSVTEDWYELTSAFLALMPGAAIALASVLRARWWYGAVSGGVASVATWATYQVYNQNSASLAAIAVLPVVVALVRAAVVPGAGRAVLVLAAVALGGLIGSYSELLSVAGLPLAAAALLGLPTSWRDRLVRASLLVATSVVVAPLAYLHAYRLWSKLSSFVPTWGRRVFTDGLSLAVARAVGTSGLDEPRGVRALTVVVLVVVAVGVVAAIASSEGRWLAVALCASVTVFLALQVRRDDNYSIERLVMVGQPLIVLTAALGLCGLAERAVRGLATSGASSEPRRSSASARAGRTPVPVPVLAAAATVAVAVVGVGVVQVDTSVRNLAPTEVLATRSVRPEVVDAIAWVADLASHDDGASVSVMPADYVDRLWLADGLRDLTEVSYPFLTLDYFGVPWFTDGTLTRWVVASRDLWTNAAPAAVVRANDEYVMIDTSVQPVWFAFPVDGFLGAEPQPDGRARQWMGASGALVVVRSAPDVPVEVTVEGNQRLPANRIDVHDTGERVVGSFEAPASDRVELPLPAGGMLHVRLESVAGATDLTDADRRQASLSIIAPTGGSLGPMAG